jgi:hypothetical protein
MKVCPYCATNNREGILFCEECGQVLFVESNLAGIASAQDMTSTRKLFTGTGGLVGKNSWGTARFQRASKILLHIKDSASPVEINPDEEVVLGRYDPVNSPRVTVDMTPYGAYENGVSRMHAIIKRGEDTLTLLDLGSVNGTVLNGQRLTPNQPRVLRDGDEIRLGKLVCHIYFKVI